MLSLRQPDRASIDRWLAGQRAQDFNYSEQGATRGTPPGTSFTLVHGRAGTVEDRPPARGYNVDRYAVKLGYGEAVYERAAAAIRSLGMWDMEWIRLCWPTTPVEVGAVLATLTHQVGVWFLNPCRIVYVIDERGPGRRFGFGYGTLRGHVERGEERFRVEQRAEDDSVWYDILAISRPAHWLVWMGYPYARRLQRRFGADSLRSMVRAVAGEALENGRRGG
jgi:uncharacterized protein (UPF0548 family)